LYIVEQIITWSLITLSDRLRSIQLLQAPIYRMRAFCHHFNKVFMSRYVKLAVYVYMHHFCIRRTQPLF